MIRNKATKKWLLQRLSALILAPLGVWFLLNIISIYNKSYLEVLIFFSNPLSIFLIFFLLIFGFYHLSIGLSEIFEDYIHNEKTKNFVNKINRFFSIIIPLVTLFLLIQISL